MSKALAEGVRQPLDGARVVKCSEKLRTLQEDTSSERGTDDLGLDVFDVRPRQEPKTDQTKSRKPQTDVGYRRHSPPLYNHRYCGQKSHDPNHVRTKRRADGHLFANVATTQKGRQATHDAQPVYNDLKAWQLNQGRLSIP